MTICLILTFWFPCGVSCGTIFSGCGLCHDVSVANSKEESLRSHSNSKEERLGSQAVRNQWLNSVEPLQWNRYDLVISAIILVLWDEDVGGDLTQIIVSGEDNVVILQLYSPTTILVPVMFPSSSIYQRL